MSFFSMLHPWRLLDHWLVNLYSSLAKGDEGEKGGLYSVVVLISFDHSWW
jgi:hypothetical protein